MNTNIKLTQFYVPEQNLGERFANFRFNGKGLIVGTRRAQDIGQIEIALNFALQTQNFDGAAHTETFKKRRKKREYFLDLVT